MTQLDRHLRYQSYHAVVALRSYYTVAFVSPPTVKSFLLTSRHVTLRRFTSHLVAANGGMPKRDRPTVEGATVTLPSKTAIKNLARCGDTHTVELLAWREIPDRCYGV